jgi:hypothetical protein
MDSVKILKEDFLNTLSYQRKSMSNDISGQIYTDIENDVPSEFKLENWDFNNRIISGTYMLCNYHYEGNALVFIDYLKEERFEMSFNKKFKSNPEIFYLYPGNGVKIINGTEIDVEMDEVSVIIRSLT